MTWKDLLQTAEGKGTLTSRVTTTEEGDEMLVETDDGEKGSMKSLWLRRSAEDDLMYDTEDCGDEMKRASRTLWTKIRSCELGTKVSLSHHLKSNVAPC